MSDPLIELIAVQPYMQLADYRTVDAFDAKIAALTDRIAAAARARRARTVSLARAGRVPGAHRNVPLDRGLR